MNLTFTNNLSEFVSDLTKQPKRIREALANRFESVMSVLQSRMIAEQVQGKMLGAQPLGPIRVLLSREGDNGVAASMIVDAHPDNGKGKASETIALKNSRPFRCAFAGKDEFTKRVLHPITLQQSSPEHSLTGLAPALEEHLQDALSQFLGVR